jgi:hypothetical protein
MEPKQLSVNMPEVSSSEDDENNGEGSRESTLERDDMMDPEEFKG